IQVFEGSAQMGKAFWMPGQVNVEFNSKPWNLPDPVKRPAIVACPDTDCNVAGVQTIVGDGHGLELFSISGGDLVPGSCVCAVKPDRATQAVESEISGRSTAAELIEVADQVVGSTQDRRPPERVLHEMLAHASASESLKTPGTQRLPSAAEVFDSFGIRRLAAIASSSRKNSKLLLCRGLRCEASFGRRMCWF